MKISKEQQQKVKAKIIKVSVDLIANNGYKKTSMRQIAKKANIGEATIYNYFLTKEHILYAYHSDLQIKTKKILIKNRDFSQFDLKKQLQFLIETELELMLENRTFILEIYEEIFYKSFKHPVLEEGNQELKSIIQELFEISIEAEEIDEIPYLSSVSYLFIDYYYAIIYYWIHDTSEQFTNTTVMIDKSLDVIYSLLQSGLISKFQDLISFVIKTHILNYVKPENKFTSETKKQTFGQKQKEPLK